MRFLREQLLIITAKLYSLINILFYHLLCGSLAKRTEIVAKTGLACGEEISNLLRSTFSVAITVG